MFGNHVGPISRLGLGRVRVRDLFEAPSLALLVYFLFVFDQRSTKQLLWDMRVRFLGNIYILCGKAILQARIA